MGGKTFQEWNFHIQTHFMMWAHDFQMYYMQTVKHHKLKQQFYLITNDTFYMQAYVVHHRANVIGLHIWICCFLFCVD